MNKLTAVKVKALSKKGRYADGRGLYLQVQGPTSKSWLLRFTLDGKARAMGLGSYPEVSLAEARERSSLHRQHLKNPDDRQDPIILRKEALKKRALDSSKRMTFMQAFERYLEKNRSGWSNPKSEGQWRSSVRDYVEPHIGERFVDEIDVQDVLAVLGPIWGTKNETARRVRGRIESVINWAKASGLPIGENPARWQGHLQNLLPKSTDVHSPTHQPSLPYQQIGSFMSALRMQDGIAAKALEFTILTACRTTECTHARWEEIDFAKAEWTIPAERMKGGKQHSVPLSKPALEVLKKARGFEGAFIFANSSSNKPLSSNGMLALLKRMNFSSVTVHGFRATFRSWAGEISKHSREVIEHALSHRVGDQAEQAYQRGTLWPKRQELMRDWAEFVAKCSQ